MATLHTVNRSPFERPSLESCLRVVRDGAAVLLLEDGVYGALAGTAHSANVASVVGRVEVYVLEPDLTARGLVARALIDGVTIVDDAGFVRLAVSHDRVVAWT